MALSTIALNDHVPASTTFTLRGQSASDANYIDTTTSLAAPLGFVVKHNVSPVGSKSNDRHTVTFSRVIVNSTTGAASVGSVKVDISIPRDANWTDAMSRALNSFMINYLTDARFQQVIDGITP